MWRVLALYISVLLIPGTILTFLALRFAGSERTEALGALDRGIEEAAEPLGRIVEKALHEARFLT